MQPMQIGGLSHEKCSIFAASPSDCWGSGDITILWELGLCFWFLEEPWGACLSYHGRP
jgi:hypothetical protein